ncbi:ubiquitin-conjugating enzyme E2 J2-like [Teleopsis dalmanni]|uniref:ubiquitin-conjugating enzyme E2 J2-like n=1 Tax=Teleopsis dalmanni TaxID=139649 RepID=UPI0018CD5F08|nr:ubiquitin-conjugating enzyme E2 J2-like [Teleopsis dalmanni]XP_037954030.1 ubiquitin-conjugating enzyme E2 J2-like [Teleopsis dalmanni]
MEVKKISSTGGRKQPTAISRMKQDYMRLKRDPLPYITAEPLPNNLLEWHYCVKGPEDTPYQGGYYHGTLLFPREFPFKPPSIFMITPNGRFRTNTRLCLSISDYHPDTWNPTWCVGTILTGLLSFMIETTPTLGAIESSTYEKQQYAKKSLAFNLKNEHFRELFPEICDEITKRLQKHQPATTGAAATITNGTVTNNNDAESDKDLIVANVANGELVNKNAHNVDNENKANAGTKGFFHTYINWQTIYSNLVIVISFCIFALIVNYVLKNLNQE